MYYAIHFLNVDVFINLFLNKSKSINLFHSMNHKREKTESNL